MALLGLHCMNGVYVTQTSYELRLISRKKSSHIATASSAIDSVGEMKSASRFLDGGAGTTLRELRGRTPSEQLARYFSMSVVFRSAVPQRPNSVVRDDRASDLSPIL